MAFCPACGKEAVDTFCESCLRERNPLLLGIKEVALITCDTCDRIRTRGQWESMRGFDKFIVRHMKLNQNAQILDVDFPMPVIERGAKEFELPVDITGTVSQHIEPYTESYIIPVAIQLERCDRCKKAGGGYFEGILQLRNPSEEVISFVEERLASEPDTHVAKAKDVRGGVDFWLTNQQFLQQFVHDLHKRFGGTVKVQSKLHTYDHQASKKVFRLTALLRLPKFRKGDVIETSKKLLRITRMGSQVRGFDLRNRRKTQVRCPEDREAILHKPENTTVSSVRPDLTILHPDNYQEVQLAHVADVRPGQKVSVVQDERGAWYLAKPFGDEKS